MSNDSANQQLSMMVLRRLDGKGRLHYQHGTTWDCDFSIMHLLNGRLQVSVVPDSIYYRLRQRRPFKIEGTDRHGNQVSVQDIHITTHTFTPERDSRDILIGYAQSAFRHTERGSYSGAITIRDELISFRLTLLASPVTVQTGDFAVEIGRLDWRDWREIEEHSNAYRHATVSTYLKIRDVPIVEQDRAIKCLQNITELLSVACRGRACLTARHKYDVEDQRLDSQFVGPPFTARGWLRKLIPDKALGDFLTAAYPHLTTKYQSLNLGNVIDHYLQTLTLPSAWPLSLGIFTAMETLKAAFFRQTENENAKFAFWVVPPDDFENKAEMFDELISVLCKHFPRFCDLRSSERNSLKAQLKNLKGRSYRTQLRAMLDQLKVSYHNRELHSFIDIRNRIIHGNPLDDTSKAWEQVEGAASLFERALLAVLGYTGPSELFDSREGRA